ncbi:YicC/YloC family endoribonuclease [Thiobacter aerophilum]|uniref:YicC/YloC family endoribonuclease n=1 Tax=Thiobacter aerophilum TaxID=3121275 RepID=A0ABV0EG29_9BURK
MIYSMTGYATASRELPNGTLNLELKSVNSRYLDLQFRIAEELRALEPLLREILVAGLSRGKVECRLSITPRTGEASLHVNHALLECLLALDQEIRQRAPQSPPLSVADMLRWPGMIAVEEVSRETVREAVLELATRALNELNASRAREGEKLRTLIETRVAAMRQLAEQVRPRLPAVVAALKEKLAARLREAGAVADDERLRQEVVLFAQRVDVDEELSRLLTHLAEVERVLAKGGAVGKRLDFLMQELNREANTLGSKSMDAEVSQIAMELKVLIEQMREQVQNIE